MSSQTYEPSPRTMVGTWPSRKLDIRVKCIQRWSVGLAMVSPNGVVIAVLTVIAHRFREWQGAVTTETVPVGLFVYGFRNYAVPQL
ncbi:hypothetical protein JCM9533A_41350 [Catenuloplanes niger JCM 9533]